MEYKVGDRVRHQEYGDGTVKHLGHTDYTVEFDNPSDGLHDGQWDDSPAFREGHCYFCNNYTVTLIPATISTMEMIKALMENPKLKAESHSEGATGTVENKNGDLFWTENNVRVSMSLTNLNATWTLIYPSEPKPVEFLEAVNSGKRIKPDTNEGWAYDSARRWFGVLSDDVIEANLKLINGKWLIEGDNNV